MHRFKIDSPYKPTGDQPQAIRKLTEGVEQGRITIIISRKHISLQPILTLKRT